MFSLFVALIASCIDISFVAGRCSYVSNYQYDYPSQSSSSYRTTYGTTVIGECNDDPVPGTELYQSRKLRCDGADAYIDLFTDEACAGSAGFTAPVTNISDVADDFELVCYPNEECTEYALARFSNSSLQAWDSDNPPTNCTAPQVEDWLLGDKVVINVCNKEKDGKSSIATCDGSGLYKDVYESSTDCTGSSVRMASQPTLGCGEFFGQIGPYGQVFYCSDASTTAQPTTALPTAQPTTAQPTTVESTSDNGGPDNGSGACIVYLNSSLTIILFFASFFLL
mmetsp:Transcript_6904/g.10872  ORF Transcript_6904/g.10872 Transcript_6904/m.10872 type:complete len:282 (+) Transcript_6904:131-976(+)|eukprot:CAMPEP_0202687092 /NCGR_PEP_ID=MMETSP1385-20130828/2798_1 /ASSEMBLY_ACC=CAM_ASM_000861 /TAXON_ID=933848 /ORGANISM="Elphidium margaritaceum" /LENGTH=281 /DNA_ID=CAMNT_0049341813 /DNA_START=123 /DNA_END=968 /DNA_ORIENTATION=+